MSGPPGASSRAVGGGGGGGAGRTPADLALSVMDRLKAVYNGAIKPLEEAYMFGEFYRCGPAPPAPPRSAAHPPPTALAPRNPQTAPS